MPIAFWWSLVFLAVFCIGLTKSGFGAGVGLFIVPLMELAMSRIPGRQEAALGVMLPLLVCGDLIAVYQYRRTFNWNLIRQLLPGTAVGVVLGSWLLHQFHRQSQRLVGPLIEMEIGLECVLLVCLHWYRIHRGMHREKYVPKRWHSQLVGAFTGTSSTLAHAAGPIVALYLLPQQIERQVFVGSCALFFFLLNLAKLPGYAASNMFARAPIFWSLRLLPLVLVGALVGRIMMKRMSDQFFTRVMYAATFALGIYIFIEGTYLLLHPAT